jgi:hypothetical protein
MRVQPQTVAVPAFAIASMQKLASLTYAKGGRNLALRLLMLHVASSQPNLENVFAKVRSAISVQAKTDSHRGLSCMDCHRI